MIYVLYGNDPARMELKLETLRKKHPVDSYERVDGSTISMGDLLGRIDTFSLFDELSMIVVEHADFLFTAKNPHLDFEALSRRDPSDKILVYLCDTSRGEKISTKKAVKDFMNQVQAIECKSLDSKSLPSLIRELAKERDLKLSGPVLEWLESHIGTNALQVASELDKLALFSLEPSLQDVQALVTREPMEEVFALTDALFARQGMRLLRLYREFRQRGMEPIAINGLLASQIRFVYKSRVYMDQGLSKNEIAALLKVSPGRMYYTMKKAAMFSAGELLGHLNDLASLDQRMKSGQVDKDAGFEEFIWNMIEKESR